MVPEKLSSVVDDLFVCQVAVGLFLAHIQHLPQSHSKGPHITGSGELTLQDTQSHYNTSIMHKYIYSHIHIIILSH